MHRRPWPILLLLLAAACAPRPQPPARPAPPPAPAPEVEQPRAEEREPTLCAALVQVIEAESHGFETLRARALGGGRFAPVVDLPGFERCEIERDYYPGAAYVCTGHPGGAFEPVSLSAAFDRIGREIDACLAGPVWYPVRWRRGELFVHARGERQLNWRQEGSFPTPLVTLKLEEDLAGAGWYLRLSVETLH